MNAAARKAGRFLLGLGLTAGAGANRAAELPAGFVAETLATGLNAATAFVLAPDGRIFIADQTGPLRVWRDGALAPAPVLDLSARLDTWWERGLVGLALDPAFPDPPHAYVLYVAKEPHPHHVLARFTWTGAAFDPASERILLTGEDQSRIRGGQPAGHQGGPLRFGPDGRLYVALGEQTAGAPAQALDSLLGKILRVERDGAIPADNPFFDRAAGPARAIWARGLRNVFGLAFQPGTGRLFATDVGQTGWEEVNEIHRGANYGWPLAEGAAGNPAFIDPLHAYPPLTGRSIVGAAFAPATSDWPEVWRGRFFFGDWAAHWIKALDPAHPAAPPLTLARGLDHPVAFEFVADGSLLVLNRGTIWRDGRRWRADSGSLVRIRHTGDPARGSAPAAWPATLAEAGVAAELAPFLPREEFVECHLNHPPWWPGVTARHWLALPAGAALTIDAAAEFEFPRGTVIVQHFTVARTGRPFETHVFRFDGPAARSRTARAAAYRWDAAGTAAVRIDEASVGPLPGDPEHRWLSPGPESTLALDLGLPGYSVPLSPRQLHRDLPTGGSQLLALSRRGAIASGLNPVQLAALLRLTAPEDAAAAPEARVRSWLDVNCASCHRPGGLGRGEFDARLVAPPPARDWVATRLIAGDLGVPGAALVAPGAPERSVLYLRLARTDALRMPPVAVNVAPPPILPDLEAWIRILGAR